MSKSKSLSYFQKAIPKTIPWLVLKPHRLLEVAFTNSSSQHCEPGSVRRYRNERNTMQGESVHGRA